MRGVLPLHPAAATSRNLGRDSAYPSRRRHNRPQPREREPQSRHSAMIPRLRSDCCAPRLRFLRACP
jgi:hypothetical protein